MMPGCWSVSGGLGPGPTNYLVYLCAKTENVRNNTLIRKNFSRRGDFFFLKNKMTKAFLQKRLFYDSLIAANISYSSV